MPAARSRFTMTKKDRAAADRGFAELARAGAAMGKRINAERRTGAPAFGWLTDLVSGVRLRPATAAEHERSETASNRAPYDGSFLLDGIKVWVDG